MVRMQKDLRNGCFHFSNPLVHRIRRCLINFGSFLGDADTVLLEVGKSLLKRLVALLSDDIFAANLSEGI